MSATILLYSFLVRCWTWLSGWDTWLFLKINNVWTCPFLDNVFPWWREANTWMPLYLFLIVFAIVNFTRRAFYWILFGAMTLTLTDQVSSSIIKNLVQRPRPCRDEFLMSHVRLLLANCSGGYSFTSSHSTNHFGFAMFVFLTMQPIMKEWRYIFLAWAATVAYGQVYVGVHYPFDVLCGGLLGSLIGYFTGTVFNRKIGLQVPVL